MLDEIRKRFESKIKINPESQCHEWQGHKENGYGRFGKKIKTGDWRMFWAHRVSYELNVGGIPEGLQLDHLCENKSCVNPKHLEPVTMTENLRRATASPWNKTHCAQGHPFEGRNLILKKSGQRRCRVCLNKWNREWRKKKRENDG